MTIIDKRVADNARRELSRRRRAAHLGVPSEHHEMVKLAEYLDAVVGKYGWLHVPNEGKRSPRAGARLKAEGMKPGAPDVLIFKRPTSGRLWTPPLIAFEADHLRARGILGVFWPDEQRFSRFTASAMQPDGIAIELKKSDAKQSAVTREQTVFGKALCNHGWAWFAAAGADAAIDEIGRLGYSR